MDKTQFRYCVLFLHYNNQLQFLYHLTLPKIKYFLKVFCLFRPFLNLYIVTLLAFLQLLPFKCTLHYLMSILHLFFIIIHCLPCSHKTMHLNRVFSCSTWINFFTLLVSNIFFPSCFYLLLFDKYRQYIYKSWNTGFIYYYFSQALVFAAKLTMF